MSASILLKLWVAAVFVLVAIVVAPAFAQTADSVVAPNSVWYEVWTVVQPIVTLLVATVGPLLVTWISVTLASLLKVSNEKQQKELEQQISNALHQSALNALKFALAKLGVALPASLDVRSPLMIEAIEYVRSKNPDAVDAFSLDDDQLADIILSKVPDVNAILAAGKVEPVKVEVKPQVVAPASTRRS